MQRLKGFFLAVQWMKVAMRFCLGHFMLPAQSVQTTARQSSFLVHPDGLLVMETATIEIAPVLQFISLTLHPDTAL
jgi:hypothetical protein